MRYGIVPYSSAVNVGALIRGVNASYLTSTTPYQTRTAAYTNYGTQTISDTGNVSETYGTTLSSGACAQYQSNVGYPTLNGSPAASGAPPNQVTTITVSARDWGGTGTTSGTSRTCRRYRRMVVTQTGYRSNAWTYRQANLDTSDFILGEPVTYATDDNGVSATSDSQTDVIEGTIPIGASTATATWNGCIEERDSTSTITGSSSNTIPNSAFDLDINRIPNNDSTRWRPMWPEIEYRRTAGSTTATTGTQMSSLDEGYWACPTGARRLQSWTRASLLAYVTSLTPIGGTYHDIGMIWGARMISNAGIFADSPDQFAGMSVSRHIIFMTDGQLAPNCNSYTSYGIEQNDQRVTGSSSCSDQYNRHLKRFNMVCNAAKSLGASIWVIAFGTTLSTDMTNCASNANQASTSSNRDQLIARFREIGSNIGALRLTQ